MKPALWEKNDTKSPKYSLLKMLSQANTVLKNVRSRRSSDNFQLSIYPQGAILRVNF